MFCKSLNGNYQLTAFLVIIMASVSYGIASLEVDKNGQPYNSMGVQFGDFITIRWFETATSGSYSNVGILVTPVDNLSVTATDEPGTVLFDVQTNTWDTPGILFGDPIDIAGSYSIAGVLSSNPWLVFTAEFYVPDLPLSTIIVFDTLVANSDPTPGPGDGMPYAEFIVIPEPTTLSLFFLGGIGLIRRRKNNA